MNEEDKNLNEKRNRLLEERKYEKARRHPYAQKFYQAIDQKDYDLARIVARSLDVTLEMRKKELAEKDEEAKSMSFGGLGYLMTAYSYIQNIELLTILKSDFQERLAKAMENRK